MSDTSVKVVLSFLRDHLCEFINKLPRDDYNTLRVWHIKAADLIEAQKQQRDELLAELAAYKEGSEEAFATVVEQKKDAQERLHRLEGTVQSQQGVIVNMRTQRDELLADMKMIAHATAPTHRDGAYHENAYSIAVAAIAKVKP